MGMALFVVGGCKRSRCSGSFAYLLHGIVASITITSNNAREDIDLNFNSDFVFILILVFVFYLILSKSVITSGIFLKSSLFEKK